MKKKLLVSFAKHLRRNMTDAERKLWSRIRNNQLGTKFKRQEPIGKYIADFVCYEKRIIIELDGSQHINSQRDKIRDDWFAKQGFRVLRYWDNEVLNNIEGVLIDIKEHISQLP
ncbi:MAG: DUF559 domain-containing protein [candidate division WOR-3 bacterium]